MRLAGALHLNKKGPSKRFYQYFLYYILVIAVLLTVMGSMVYKNFITILQDEVGKSNMAHLQKLNETFDMRIKEMEHLAVSISLNDVLSYNSFIGDSYGSLKCVEELRKYQASNFFVSDIFYYNDLRENKKIYTTQGAYSPELLFSSVYRFENWGSTEFTDVLNTETRPYVRAAEPVKSNGINPCKYISYVFPIPLYDEKPKSIVLFLIKDTTFYNTIDNILKDYSGYIYILGPDNRPIFQYSSGKGDGEPSDILNSIDISGYRDGTTDIELDGTEFSVTKIKSQYNMWSYVTVMSTRQLFGKVITTRRIFQYTVAAVFILGVLMAFGFASNQYKSLLHLANSVKKQWAKLSIPMSAEKDEIKLISKGIESMGSENSSLNRQLRNSMKRVRSQMLLSLLKQEKSDGKTELEMINALDIDFEGGSGTGVLLFLVDNYKEFKKNNGSGMEDLLKFSVINVAEELAGEYGAGYGVDLLEDGKVSVILCVKPGISYREAVEEFAGRLKDFFREHYKIFFTVGVGRVYPEISGVRDSYLEACRAASYRLIAGRDRVIFCEDLDLDSPAFYPYPSDLADKLKLAVKQASKEQTRAITDELMDDITSKNVTPEMAQFIYFGIINSVIKALDDVNAGFRECGEIKLDSYIPGSFETMEDMRSALMDFCIRVCDYLETQRECKNTRLMEAICSFLQQNYSDSALSLDRISELFGVSSSYCGKMFKSYTGCSVMQYVDTLRMEKAKELLKDTCLSLQAILDRVGYVDKVNFIRKFKKNEGVPPIQFRNSSRRGYRQENI